MNSYLKVLVMEEQTLLRSGIVAFLCGVSNQIQATEASCFEEGNRLIRRGKFDMIILDINLHPDNIRVVQQIRTIDHSFRILVYSGYDEHIYAIPCIHAGANGFLSKKSTNDEFLKAFHTVLSGKRYLSPGVQQLILDLVGTTPSRHRNSNLSKQEHNILQMLRNYHSTSEIAVNLGLKQNTVNAYKKRIFQKLRVQNEREFFKKISMGN